MAEEQLSNDMTKEQAMKLLEEGNTLTHEYFTPDEFITMTKEGLIQYSGGPTSTVEEFWKYRLLEGWHKGWSIYKP